MFIFACLSVWLSCHGRESIVPASAVLLCVYLVSIFWSQPSVVCVPHMEVVLPIFTCGSNNCTSRHASLSEVLLLSARATAPDDLAALTQHMPHSIKSLNEFLRLL